MRRLSTREPLRKVFDYGERDQYIRDMLRRKRRSRKQAQVPSWKMFGDAPYLYKWPNGYIAFGPFNSSEETKHVASMAWKLGIKVGQLQQETVKIMQDSNHPRHKHCSMIDFAPAELFVQQLMQTIQNRQQQGKQSVQLSKEEIKQFWSDLFDKTGLP